MTLQRRVILAALVLVAFVASFWVVIVAPARTELGAARTAVSEAQARLDAAIAAAAQIEQTRAQYRRDYRTVQRLNKAVPTDDDVASLVRQLDAVARANDVDFRALRLTGSAGPAVAAQPPSTDDAAKSTTSKDEKDEPAAETTPVAPVVAQAPPGAVVGPAGLLTLPFSLTFDGGYLEMQRFLKAIDGLAKRDGKRIRVRGRLLTVDGFSLAASRKGFPKLQALVGATAYIAPELDGVIAAATSRSPTGVTATPASVRATAAGAQGAAR